MNQTKEVGKRPIVWALQRTFAPGLPTGLGLASLLIYSLFFYYVITASNLGVFLVVVPLWEIFLLIISGSLVVATSAAYSLASTRKRGIAIGGVEGTTTFILGTTVVSCACNAPVLATALYSLGFDALQVSSAIAFLSSYQLPIACVLISGNLLLCVRYLLLTSRFAPRTPIPH